MIVRMHVLADAPQNGKTLFLYISKENSLSIQEKTTNKSRIRKKREQKICIARDTR